MLMYDQDYYRQRESICRKHAADATDPAIAAIHREMAERYAALLSDQTASSRQPRQRLSVRVR